MRKSEDENPNLNPEVFVIPKPWNPNPKTFSSEPVQPTSGARAAFFAFSVSGSQYLSRAALSLRLRVGGTGHSSKAVHDVHGSNSKAKALCLPPSPSLPPCPSTGTGLATLNPFRKSGTNLGAPASASVTASARRPWGSSLARAREMTRWLPPGCHWPDMQWSAQGANRSAADRKGKKTESEMLLPARASLKYGHDRLKEPQSPLPPRL